jgi:hypothetical protein
VLAVDVGREQPEAEILGKRQDAVLGRPDPLPAELDHGPVGQRVVQESTADAVAGLQDEDRDVSGYKIARGDQSGHAGPNHYDVDSFGDVRLVHPVPSIRRGHT